MNKVMRSLLVLAIVAFSVNANAQITIGAKAGLNLANNAYSFEDADFEPSSTMKVGFHVGVAAEVGFSDNLALQTGLIFTQKGSNADLEETYKDAIEAGATVDGSSKTNLNYLEIPLTIALKTDGGFQAYAGPYIAIGMGGKIANDFTVKDEFFEIESTDDTTLKSIFGDVKEGDLADDEGAFSGLDLGLNFGVGYLLSEAFLINAGYSLGLGNTVPGLDGVDDFDPADQKTTNGVITVSGTYWFGK